MDSKKRSKQLMIVGICVVATFIGLYLQLFKKEGGGNTMQETAPGGKWAEKGQEGNGKDAYDYAGRELPDIDNETTAESYTEGPGSEVYFTNTGTLDESSLPLSAHRVLCQASQSFLTQSGYGDVTELYVKEDSLIDNGEEVSFLCLLDGYEEQLKITFNKGESKLKFNIVTIEHVNR